MGGYGSGEWRIGKATTEQSKRLDIRFMMKQSWLVPGKIGILSWSIGGESSGSIGYVVHDDRLVLNYNYTPYGQDESRSVTQGILFDETECHFGGKRKWFVCPDCGSRREILYSHKNLFICRKCADLSYQCQHEQPLDRHYRQARKVRHKLVTDIGKGTSLEFNPDNLSHNPLFKPKGMHQRTFDKLRYKQALYINSGMQYVSARQSVS